jgi:beta-lactamase class D
VSRPGLSALLAAAALLLVACNPAADINTERLEAELDPAVGGPDTCVVIDEVKSGREVYRYGAESVCNRPLAPCATFQIPMALIGLSDGQLKPDETWMWDGQAQPYKAWEHDMDLKAAWRSGADWYFRRLARAIGAPRFRQALSAFGYGQGAPVGRPDSFWEGPAAGGGLFLSTRNQAQVLRRLALGSLPVKPEAAAAVEGLMADQTRGAATLSDLGATCPSIADASRNVSWWVARIKGSGQDLVLALSIESENPLPGAEIRSRMLPILTDARLLPAP